MIPKFLSQALDGVPLVVFGDGTQSRDFTYVNEIVAGLALAPKAPPGAVMNLGGGNRVGLNEAIATLGEVAGVEPKLTKQAVEAGEVRDTWAEVSRAIVPMWCLQTTHLKAGIAEKSAWLAGKSEDVRGRS